MGAKKERAGTRAELVENIMTARENIAGTREQIGLLGTQTEQILGEHGRRESQEVGAQRGAFAGSGVRVGAGGTAAGLRAETQRVRGEERKSIRDVADVQRRQLEREVGQLGRRETQMESALREMGSGGLFKGRRKKEHYGQLEELGFQFTEGF